MLDECKGEKFEELLFIFSATVLKKRVRSIKQNQSPPIAQILGSTDNLRLIDSKTTLPLILAHRASLQTCKERRKVCRSMYQAFDSVMREQQRIVRQSYQDISAAQQCLKKSLSPDSANIMHTEVQRNWAGSTQGRQLLLGKDEAASESAGESSIYLDALQNFQETGLFLSRENEPVLLDTLKAALEEQNRRLTRWSQYTDQLQTTSRPADVKIQAESATNKVLQFNKHQEIRIGSAGHRRPGTEGDCPIPKYEHIIENMLHNVSEITQRRRRRIVPPVKQLERNPVKGSSYQDLRHSFAPIFAQPDGTKSVLSRNPKFDLFSPIKLAGTSSGSPPSQPSAARVVGPDSSSGSFSSNVVPKPSINRRELEGSSLARSYNPEDTHGSLDGPDRKPHDIGLHLPPPDSLTDIASEPSSTLAARARMSMALDSTDLSGFPPSASTAEPRTNNTNPTAPSTTLDRRFSLLDRTRQSVNFATSGPQSEFKRRQQKASRQSVSYPVNQFETPIKSKTYVAADDENSGSQHAGIETTPKDMMFSEDAEYASVFKSRPKIAVSPVLSPTMESPPPGVYDSADDMQGLHSSPLGNLGDRRRGLA